MVKPFLEFQQSWQTSNKNRQRFSFYDLISFLRVSNSDMISK